MLTKGGKRMMRKVAILLAVMGLMVMAYAGVALAVTKTGDAGPNRLVGTAENDTLRGRGGADTIIGKGDSDRLYGGRGGDHINARERGRAEDDLVDCGRGRDTVLTDNTTEDRVLANCEVIKRG
jgi:Ca2+-binding RTX toxin-like protein